MKKVAYFEKVPFDIFYKDYIKSGIWKRKSETDQTEPTEAQVERVYDSIQLPSRSTARSSGYDFYFPELIVCEYKDSVLVPSGIRCVFIEDGYDLSIMPRSGLGFKRRLQLDNTIGLIDNDYWEAENRGHIMVKMTCDDNDWDNCIIEPGKAYAQGVFREFFITVDDYKTNKSSRMGGFGSTDSDSVD